MKHAEFALRCKIAAAIVMTTVLTLVAAPAWAHGGQSPKEGYVMVQQAISFLANEPDAKGTSEALVRVDDALNAEDQDGVDIPVLEQAKAALNAGNADGARPLLQSSIKAAVASLKPATGDETGGGWCRVFLPAPPSGELGRTGQRHSRRPCSDPEPVQHAIEWRR